MATKTIENIHFYVPITTYTYEDREFHTLRVSVRYCKGRGFRASFTPGWGDNYGWGCVIDGSNNPLTAGMTVDVEPATKNSAKRIAEMTESLKMAKDVIAALFDDREWEKLKAVLQSAAKFGYTEKFKEQAEKYLAARVSKRYEKAVKPIESETNNENNNQNSTTMEKKNYKAADLIGKTIVVSDENGAVKGTIAIKGVQDNGFLSCEFKKPGDTATTPMPVSIANLTAMVGRGVWKLQDAATAETVTTEADVEEVDDIKPVVTPRKKSEEPAPAKTIEMPKAAEPKPTQGRPKQQPKAGKPAEGGVKYTYATYQTSKGKTGAKITGVSETDAAYQQAAAIHASGSYTKDKDGNKHFYLCFGPRYAEAAKKVCELLNAGKPIEDAIAVVNAATEERATKREEWKQKREERNAEKVKAMTPEEQAMFELFKKFMAGDKDAMAKVGAVMTKKAA